MGRAGDEKQVILLQWPYQVMNNYSSFLSTWPYFIIIGTLQISVWLKIRHQNYADAAMQESIIIMECR